VAASLRSARSSCPVSTVSRVRPEMYSAVRTSAGDTPGREANPQQAKPGKSDANRSERLGKSGPNRAISRVQARLSSPSGNSAGLRARRRPDRSPSKRKATRDGVASKTLARLTVRRRVPGRVECQGAIATERRLAPSPTPSTIRLPSLPSEFHPSVQAMRQSVNCPLTPLHPSMRVFSPRPPCAGRATRSATSQTASTTAPDRSGRSFRRQERVGGIGEGQLGARAFQKRLRDEEPQAHAFVARPLADIGSRGGRGQRGRRCGR
jgi:hypothetical protein